MLMSPQTHSRSVEESDLKVVPFRSGRSYPNLARNVSWSALELGDLLVNCQSGYFQPLPVSSSRTDAEERHLLEMILTPHTRNQEGSFA